MNVVISGKLKRSMTNDRLLVRDKIKKESQIILLRTKQRVLLGKKNKSFDIISTYKNFNAK
ncbi:hypothetical protein C9J27_26050 [Photobacterium kishitanii]|uniref:Uncharacterized protein n=1 Tax=Photobacterium kishitanii TaxID=318456 RepID=A0A2T3K9Z3_9GAMM|nr:hypothetical protein C9J27_26050 [Photobacterium kishitanii]